MGGMQQPSRFSEQFLPPTYIEAESCHSSHSMCQAACIASCWSLRDRLKVVEALVVEIEADLAQWPLQGCSEWWWWWSIAARFWWWRHCNWRWPATPTPSTTTAWRTWPAHWSSTVCLARIPRTWRARTSRSAGSKRWAMWRHRPSELSSPLASQVWTSLTWAWAWTWTFNITPGFTRFFHILPVTSTHNPLDPCITRSDVTLIQSHSSSDHIDWTP